MKHDIIFVKSNFRGIEATWVVVPEDDKLDLWKDNNYEKFPHFDLFAEAKEHCEKNRLEIGEVTNITYYLNEDDNEMKVWIDNVLDATYTSVLEDKQALSLLEEDYGV